MHIEDVEKFTTWLTKELRPLCDAEPASLAKYVLALIRKPERTVEEIRQFCNVQLEIFLQGSTKMFVDKMFAALKDNSYIPQKTERPEPPKSSDAESKKEKDEKSKDKKEKDEKRLTSDVKPTTSTSSRDRTEKDVDSRKRPAAIPAKKEEPARKEAAVVSTARIEKPTRKRISPPPVDAKDSKSAVSREKERDNTREAMRRRSRSRSPRSRRERTRRSPEHQRNRHARRSRSRTRSRSADRERRDRKIDDERRRKRCRDYDEKGFCMRGDMCQFDHGPDPVVVDHDSAIEKIVKGQPAPNFSVPPPGYNPVNPPAVVEVYSGSASSVEGYNPEAPALSTAGPNFSVPPPPLPMHINNSQWRPYVAPGVQAVSYDPSSGIPVDPSSTSAAGIGSAIMVRGMRGRGRGGFVGHYGPRLPISKGDGRTIMVRKIPVEHNTIAKLNEHFATFGNIDNIQVRYKGEPDTALITYANRTEAISAIKSPSPVLNNRFIKVLWYTPEVDDENSATVGGGGVRKLNSGLNVEKPAPSKIASVREAKFVNQAVVEERSKRKQAKIAIKGLQAKRADLVKVRAAQQLIFDKSMDSQKSVMSMLREVEKVKEKDAQKKRLTEIYKTNLTRMQESKALVSDLDAQILKLDEEILDNSKILNNRLSADNEGNRNSESPELIDEVSITVEDTKDVQLQPREHTYDDESDAVVVKGFKFDDEHRVTEVMEQYGDLLDVEILPGENETASAVYIYKERGDAESAVLQGVELDGQHLTVSWKQQDVKEPRPKDIVIHFSSTSDDHSVHLD